MAKIDRHSGYEVYTIISDNGRSRASLVPEKGGVASSIVLPYDSREREILYLQDNFWEKGHFDLLGGWPFLFPICGRLERRDIAGNYLYDGNIYNLPIHGFAPYLPWEVMQAEDNKLSMRLTDSKDTHAMYPFEFKVELTYIMDNGGLACEQVYSNTGDKPMPYYAGFHPYFLTGQPGVAKEKVMVNFQPTRVLRCNEHLTDLVGEKKAFKLPSSITNPQINEQLSEVGKDNITELKYPDNFQLFMTARGYEDPEMFKYLQIYTIPEQPFICLEPWMGFPNALNSVQGVRWLQPGQSEKGVIALSCIGAKEAYCSLRG